MFYIFKQNSADELMPSPVGSQMCISDSPIPNAAMDPARHPWEPLRSMMSRESGPGIMFSSGLLYTSDAADDLTRVDGCDSRVLHKENSICSVERGRVAVDNSTQS